MLLRALLLLTLWPSLAVAEVVDRVVVVVESHLILASEIDFEGALSQVDASESPFWMERRDDPLERLVDAAIIRLVASDVSLYQPSADAVRQRLEGVRTRFETRGLWAAFLQRWGMDEDRLQVALRRRMVVERYLARNVQVDLAEREAWLDACRALLDDLRPRARVRVIPEVGEP